MNSKDIDDTLDELDNEFPLDLILDEGNSYRVLSIGYEES